MAEAGGKTWCTTGWDQGAAEERLRAAHPEALEAVEEFRGERTLVVRADALLETLAFLRDDPELTFDMLTDVTAVHWPARAEAPFDVVHLLYSFPRNARLRIKTRVADPPRVRSAAALWPAAGWLERECFDMFGVAFEGHPDLRRILLPDGFAGHPLRKEFPLKG